MRLNKGLIGVIALGAVLTFAGCGSNDDANQTTGTTEVTTEATTETTTETEADTTNEDTSGEDTAPEEGTAEHSEELTRIHDAVKEAYGESYVPNMEYDSETAKEPFGLQPEWYDDTIAEGPMISVHVDTFIAVHPTEGNEQNVEDALNAYRDNLVNNSMQYPANQVKVEASRVETVGDYVFFLMLGSIDLEIEDEAEMLTAYQEQNQIAVDAIKEVLGL